ncbi:MAG: beta-galactosidase small subunit [Bacteroidota bacterium]
MAARWAQETITVETQLYFPDIEKKYTFWYVLAQDGSLMVKAQMSPPYQADLPEIPRVGLRCFLNSSLQQIDWLGRGPHENYVDRKAAAFVGWHHKTVQEMYEPYISPQEHGSRTDVRSVAFCDATGKGLLVSGNDFSFTASPYSPAELTRTKWGELHTYDLPKSNKISLCLDHQQMGLGGIDSWLSQPLEKYRIRPELFDFYFVFKVV